MIKKKLQPKPTDTSNMGLNEAKMSIINNFVDKAQRAGLVTYEEIIDFVKQYGFNKADTRLLIKQLEKENIELIVESELESSIGSSSEGDDDQASQKMLVRLDGNEDSDDEDEADLDFWP